LALNYGQKLFFWLMFYGVIVLLVSGWRYGRRIDSMELALAALSAFSCTSGGLATIGAFIIHVYMGLPWCAVALPRSFEEKVSAAWPTHHRLWTSGSPTKDSQNERRDDKGLSPQQQVVDGPSTQVGVKHQSVFAKRSR